MFAAFKAEPVGHICAETRSEQKTTPHSTNWIHCKWQIAGQEANTDTVLSDTGSGMRLLSTVAWVESIAWADASEGWHKMSAGGQNTQI
jgi:hypothetical protein